MQAAGGQAAADGLDTRVTIGGQIEVGRVASAVAVSDQKPARDGLVARLVIHPPMRLPMRPVNSMSKTSWCGLPRVCPVKFLAHRPRLCE